MLCVSRLMPDSYLFLYRKVVYSALEKLFQVHQCPSMVSLYHMLVHFQTFQAHQQANAIHRCFTSRNTDLLVRAYHVYVHPLLEYNSVIWSPHLKCNTEAIETVQRRFTKRLPGYHRHSYSERLWLLQLPSLETRRLQNDLIWCYKTVFGHTITYSDFFKCS